MGKPSSNPKPSYEQLEAELMAAKRELAELKASLPDDERLNHLRFVQTLFDMIPNPVFYKNRAGIYLGCNRAFADLILGIPEERIIGCSLYDLPDRIPKKLADIYFEQDQALFDNPGLQVYETKVRCADAVMRDFLFYKTTYTDHRGRVAGLLGLMLDVTEKNRIQLELAESEEKYRSMMESMREAVYICSPELKISYMNPGMIRMVGRDATGEDCHRALHGLETPCNWCGFDKVRKGEKVEMEIQSPRDNRTYLVTSSPIFHQDSSISKMTIYRDITERKRLEQELLMARKIESAGVFAGGIAHDYNNLLFIVLGNLLMLKKEPDCPERDNLLLAAEEAAQKGAELTRRLLTFTHGDPLNLVKKPITGLLESIGTKCQQLQRCSITLEVADNLPEIPIDLELMNIVCENIIKNSVEAMNGEGSIRISADLVQIDESSPEIQQKLLPSGGIYLRLCFTDDGPGIDQQVLPKIFDPYFSTKNSPTTKGLGLGLSTAYSIVRKHNGTMSALSDTGHGTSIVILLPSQAAPTISPDSIAPRENGGAFSK